MNGLEFNRLVSLTDCDNLTHFLVDVNSVIIAAALKRGGYDNVTVACYYQA